MAKTKTRKSKKARDKQKFIPGTEPVRIKALDDAAAEYEDGRDERMEASKVEVERKKKLIDLMHAHDLTQYVIPGTDPPREIVLIPEDETVKVRALKMPKPKAKKNKAGANDGTQAAASEA